MAINIKMMTFSYSLFLAWGGGGGGGGATLLKQEIAFLVTFLRSKFINFNQKILSYEKKHLP